jgi:hypothetical protein
MYVRNKNTSTDGRYKQAINLIFRFKRLVHGSSVEKLRETRTFSNFMKMKSSRAISSVRWLKITETPSDPDDGNRDGS